MIERITTCDIMVIHIVGTILDDNHAKDVNEVAMNRIVTNQFGHLYTNWLLKETRKVSKLMNTDD